MMSRDSIVSRLAAAVSVLLAAALIATVTVVFWPRVAQAMGMRPPASASRPAYRSGERVDVPAAWYRTAAQAPTLVIFGRETCGACQQAQPFLKDLVANALVAHVHVVFAGRPETKDDDGKFARSLGVPDAGITSAPGGLRVRATPTLVLISPTGRVINAWEGVGDPTKQRQIARAVATAH